MWAWVHSLQEYLLGARHGIAAVFQSGAPCWWSLCHCGGCSSRNLAPPARARLGGHWVNKKSNIKKSNILTRIFGPNSRLMPLCWWLVQEPRPSYYNGASPRTLNALLDGAQILHWWTKLKPIWARLVLFHIYILGRAFFPSTSITNIFENIFIFTWNVAHFSFPLLIILQFASDCFISFSFWMCILSCAYAH